MSYTFQEHLHYYACWTAARAVQRSFTKTPNIIKAIESSDLVKIEKMDLQSPEEYDSFHRKCCNQIVDCFENHGIPASYGRAAKIVAIYLNHPPIDRILLTNLHKEYRKLGFANINWTQLNEEAYFKLIAKIRELPFHKFWELERYWNLE